MLMFNSPPDYEDAKDKSRNFPTGTIDDADPTNDYDEDFFDYYDPGSEAPAPNALGYVDQDQAESTFPDGILPRNREFEGGDNKYQITIRATETEGDTNRALSTRSTTRSKSLTGMKTAKSS